MRERGRGQYERERERWGNEWVRERGSLLKRERGGIERERERKTRRV